MNEQSPEHVIERTVEDCYAELPEDWVGLWQIAAHIERAYPTAEWTEVRRISLEVVRRLLSDPRIYAGRPSTVVDRGFDRWPLTPQESLDRIAAEWGALGRGPNIDEICWFDLD